MSDGFLGRWSKRKLEVKQGKAQQAAEVEDLQASQAVPPPQPSPERGGSEEQGEGVVDLPPPPGEGRGGGSADQSQAPTLEDVEALTAESDFSRFAAGNVSPEVKNAAMKKLFADPRYNVMDGLDVYTGDYSRPDPIPHAILRKLASARFLGLFDEEEKQEAAVRQARDVADNLTEQTVAQSSAAPQAVSEVPQLPEHADPDLRLQQDHAAPGKEPGRGTG